MINNIIYSLKISWKVSPVRNTLDFFVRLIYRSYTVFYGVFFLGYVLNIIEKNENINALWLLIGISILIMIVYDFLAAWYYNTYKPYADQNVFKKYRMLIYEKTANVDLEYYENKEFYNNYTKASKEIVNRFESVLCDTLEIIIDILMNTYLCIVVFRLDTFAIIICFFPILMNYVIGKKINTERYKLYIKNVEPNRRKEYVKRTIYLKDFTKEIRTSNIFNVLNDKFHTTSNEIITNIKKYGVKIAILNFINSVSFVIFTYFVTIIYASYKALVAQTLSVGDYIILVNAISKLSSMLVGFIDKILKFNENSKYILNIKDFLNLQPKLSNGNIHPSANATYNIKFQNVSFAYIGQTEPCLKNINISICSGEKIAIVGLNGAGKSTLVKLLMRLYDVSDGKIKYNGLDIKDYDKDEYRAMFSTVFQDYRIFAATIAENVLLDINENKDFVINNALINSGIYQMLFEKYGDNACDKVLTKEFDNEGLVLSGGHTQKIAVSRVFVKKGGIAILDEPSSALDPVAEKEMFKNLLDACIDKTIIFISHRLSAVALADRIYVIENGSVEEQGTHEQLINIKGIYYNMYVKQNKKFMSYGETDDE